MPHPNKPVKHGHGGNDTEFVTSNLWVGNLAPNVTHADLMEVFGKYGPVDDVTSYAPKTFGFVYFKHMNSAKVAKEALQGHVIKGNPIRIEFAKPAKPSKHLWVGGISSSVTKEELEEEFLKFGKLEDFKFVRDRNSAFIDYGRVEDATAAVRNLNGKLIGGENIRVDYLRSQTSRKEPSEFHDPRDLHFRGMVGSDPSFAFRDPLGLHSETASIGYRRQPFDAPGSRNERQPSRILWVGYPPSVIVDEQMLYNAMILFGEIERIKCFPSRHYSFVEFRSVEEAKNAKENLQGKLFNDPRISIMFSSSDMAPKDFTAPFQGFQGPRVEMFASDVPLLPPMMDAYGNSLVDGPSYSSGGVLGPGPARPPGPGGFSRKRLSPTPRAHHPSPAHNSGFPRNNIQSGWDVHDDDQIPRELKRARTYGFAATKGNDFSSVSDHLYGSANLEGGQVRPLQAGVSRAPIEVRGSGDYIWRGVIAKGGSAVCNARCIPVGKGIDFDLPEVVNCSAKTGLDMLAKHCAEAVGFEIVFFLPDSVEDFASYTEFLRFLGSKSRAGVAKFDDGTTMFLVPPSDFLTDVLNVIGPERLYGVVLKLKHQIPSNVSTEGQTEVALPSVHSVNHMPAHAPNDYSNLSSQREHFMHMDPSQSSMIPPKLPVPPTTFAHSITQPPHQDLSNNGVASASQSGVPLTPEMIATLASLLPANSQSSMAHSGGHPPIPSPSTARPADSNAGQDRSTYSQGWSQHYQPSGQIVQPPHQFDNQLGSHAPPHSAMNFQHFPAISSGNSLPSQNQVFPENTYNQNPAYYGYQQQGAASSGPPAVHPDLSQANQYMAPAQVALQPYQQEALPQNSMQRGYGPGLDMAPSFVPYGLSSDPQQQRVPGANSYNPPDNTLSSSTVNYANSGPVNQQPVSAAPGMGTGEVEGDKNQRYQSTLQFAANLLLQIQQQGGSQSGQGNANQQ